MTTHYDLVVLGEINPDLILNGENVVPLFGQVEKFVDQADLTVGSSSVITAFGAAKLGLRVAFIGVVGDDIFGRFMLDAMQEVGIDIQHCIIDPQLQTGLTVILSQRGQDRAMLTFSGSISALTLDHINPAIWQQTRHLHVGSYFMLDGIRADLPHLFEQVRAQGVSVSLDTNWDPREQWEITPVLAHIDVLFPNSAEISQLTRQPFAAGLNQLAEKVPLLVVKMGKAGGLVRHGADSAQAPIIPVNVIDTVGAGDSFNAGFLYGMLQGFSNSKSLHLATICGSLSTRAAGGTATQATLAEAMQLITTIEQQETQSLPGNL